MGGTEEDTGGVISSPLDGAVKKLRTQIDAIYGRLLSNAHLKDHMIYSAADADRAPTRKTVAEIVAFLEALSGLKRASCFEVLPNLAAWNERPTEDDLIHILVHLLSPLAAPNFGLPTFSQCLLGEALTRLGSKVDVVAHMDRLDFYTQGPPGATDMMSNLRNLSEQTAMYEKAVLAKEAEVIDRKTNDAFDRAALRQQASALEKRIEELGRKKVNEAGYMEPSHGYFDTYSNDTLAALKQNPTHLSEEQREMNELAQLTNLVVQLSKAEGTYAEDKKGTTGPAVVQEAAALLREDTAADGANLGARMREMVEDQPLPGVVLSATDQVAVKAYLNDGNAEAKRRLLEIIDRVNTEARKTWIQLVPKWRRLERNNDKDWWEKLVKDFPQVQSLASRQEAEAFVNNTSGLGGLKVMADEVLDIGDARRNVKERKAALKAAEQQYRRSRSESDRIEMLRRQEALNKAKDMLKKSEEAHEIDQIRRGKGSDQFDLFTVLRDTQNAVELRQPDLDLNAPEFPDLDRFRYHTEEVTLPLSVDVAYLVTCYRDLLPKSNLSNLLRLDEAEEKKKEKKKNNPAVIVNCMHSMTLRALHLQKVCENVSMYLRDGAREAVHAFRCDKFDTLAEAGKWPTSTDEWKFGEVPVEDVQLYMQRIFTIGDKDAKYFEDVAKDNKTRLHDYVRERVARDRDILVKLVKAAVGRVRKYLEGFDPEINIVEKPKVRSENNAYTVLMNPDGKESSISYFAREMLRLPHNLPLVGPDVGGDGGQDTLARYVREVAIDGIPVNFSFPEHDVPHSDVTGGGGVITGVLKSASDLTGLGRSIACARHYPETLAYRAPVDAFLSLPHDPQVGTIMNSTNPNATHESGKLYCFNNDCIVVGPANNAQQVSVWCVHGTGVAVVARPRTGAAPSLQSGIKAAPSFLNTYGKQIAMGAAGVAAAGALAFFGLPAVASAIPGAVSAVTSVVPDNIQAIATSPAAKRIMGAAATAAVPTVGTEVLYQAAVGDGLNRRTLKKAIDKGIQRGKYAAGAMAANEARNLALSYVPTVTKGAQRVYNDFRPATPQGTDVLNEEQTRQKIADAEQKTAQERDRLGKAREQWKTQWIHDKMNTFDGPGSWLFYDEQNLDRDADEKAKLLSDEYLKQSIYYPKTPAPKTDMGGGGSPLMHFGPPQASPLMHFGPPPLQGGGGLTHDASIAPTLAAALEGDPAPHALWRRLYGAAVRGGGTPTPVEQATLDMIARGLDRDAAPPDSPRARLLFRAGRCCAPVV